eukprot:Gb_35292 [translate_table: standard]
MASYEKRFEKGEKQKRARNWEVDEIILLVQAKWNEWEKYESSNTRDRFESASDKWKKIVEYLQAQGVQERDTTQARMKWENIISDFKAIKDWNRRSGNAPFFIFKVADLALFHKLLLKQQTKGLAGDREQGSIGKVPIAQLYTFHNPANFEYGSNSSASAKLHMGYVKPEVGSNNSA